MGLGLHEAVLVQLCGRHTDNRCDTRRGPRAAFESGSVRNTAEQRYGLGEVAGSAATAVTDTAAGVGSYVQRRGVLGLTDDLAGGIRRYPLLALLIGIGIGLVLGRTVGKATTTEGA